MTQFDALQNDFFGICMPLAYYFGMLPDILKNQNKTFRSAYNVYVSLVYLLAIFCNLSQLIKLYQILTNENFIFEELIRNYIITSYHFSALIRCLFVRGKLSGGIFKRVIRFEKKIYGSKNENIINVYKSHLTSVKNTKTYYLAGFVVVVIFYIAAPVLRDPYYIQRGNETIVIRQVPLSSWTPVDDKYWFAFAWTSAAGAYLTIFFVTTDLICYSFIVFGICQIDILHHFITNFFKYSLEFRETHGYSQIESFRVLQRKCIIMHQEIISYVKDLNGSLKRIMLLDFLPSSIQLAGIIFQLMTNLSLIQCILLGEFTCTLIARIFIYCNSAHWLSIRSQSIAMAWFEVDWTELPSDVRQNIILCIVRSQKPLKITIGDFQAITIETFLMILKGTYSYMMLLTTI